MSTVKDRIVYYLEYKHITKAYFCKAIGASPSFLNSMRKGLSTEKIDIVVSAFPDLNRDWLLFGEGPMLRTADAPKPTQQSTGDNSHNVMGNNNMVGNTINTTHAPVCAQENAVRPIVPVELYKKPNTDIYNEIVEKPSSGIEYAQYFRSFSDFCMYMRVQGDSMSPNFLRGDLLALSLLKATYILNGTIYVLDTKSYGLVLRVVIDRGDIYECHVIGDETRYAPFSVPKTDVIRIYKVMGLIRTCVS